MDVRRFYSTAYVFGEVAIGFDRVLLQCTKGPTVDAVVVNCADHLPFGPTADREQGEQRTCPVRRVGAITTAPTS